MLENGVRALLMNLLPLMFMIIELFAAEFMFAARLRRRKLFWFRFIGSLAVCLELAFAMLLLYYKITDTAFSYGGTDDRGMSAFKFVLYVVIFAFTVACNKFCYDDSVWMIMFYCSGAYATQHMSKNVASLLLHFTGIEALWAYYLIELAVCAALYALVWFIFVRGRTLPNSKQDVIRKVILSFIVIFICIGLSRISVDNTNRDTVSFIAETVYGVVCCALVLVILSDINKIDNMQSDLNIMTELLSRERSQYKMSKENVELINMKYHDLKHQLSELKSGYSLAQIEKIENAIMFCGSIARTGNDVLDVILTEKSLYCEKNSISLTCVCNGSGLSFMDKCDVYSLFGNALTNAIESVSEIEDKKKRSISVNVQPVGNMLSVHIENFYEGEIIIEDNLPRTSKDRDYHGFGIKSMDYIARQYGGHMSVSAKNGRFSLDFVFPLPKPNEKETEKSDDNRGE